MITTYFFIINPPPLLRGLTIKHIAALRKIKTAYRAIVQPVSGLLCSLLISILNCLDEYLHIPINVSFI